MSIACSSGDQEQQKTCLSDATKTRKSEFDLLDPGSDVTNDRFEILEEFSSLGIDDIVSLLQLADYKGKNVNITADERRETNSLFPDEGFSSFWTTNESGILSRKATNEANMNLQVSLNGKVVKIPMEHDDEFTTKLKNVSGSQVSLKSQTQGPSDGAAMQDKNSTSNHNGGQTVSGGGSPVTGGCKSSTGGRPNSASSSGSGGDDGGDDRRPNVPGGGCQGDSQCDVEGQEKQRETEQEEQKHKDSDDDDDDGDDDCDGDCDGDSDCDIGDDDDDDADDDDDDDDDDDNGDRSCNNDDNKEEEQCSLPEATGNTQVDKNQTAGVNSKPCGSSSSTSCFVSEGPLVSSNESGHQSSWSDKCHRNTSKPFAMSCLDGAKKSSDQGLKLDVNTARRISQATASYCGLQEASECSLDDQITCQLPESDHEADVQLRKAFTCRHNMRAWEECSDASCQAIQQSIAHTQNCRMRVLGGCSLCIHYKNILLLHASRCEFPIGDCIIEKCDDIRKYMESKSIPGNRNWTYDLDQLFFKPTPPRSPTLIGIFSDPSPSEDEPDDQAQPSSFFGSNGDSLNLSSRSFTETTSRSASGVWNQYHVDRPPDLLWRVEEGQHLSALTVTRGPTVDGQIHLQEHVEDESVISATPLSAVCMPDATAAENSTPKEEVIWPLNTEHLSVGDEGSYVENVHWRRVHHIGGGSCGRCYLCIDLKTEFLFAIKRIPEGIFEMTEVEIWGSLSGRHPNILELFGAVKSENKVTIFMEYMEGGSVENVGKMHEALACHIFCKVLAAVDYMHSQGIIHRDIKGANILMDETGEKVKLADFGTSIRLSNGYQQDNMPRGTEPFMAPEVCRSHPHSFSADIWSLMCALYQMLKGVPPWEQYHHCHRLTLLFQIGDAKQPPPSPPCSPELEDLFSQGFQLKPTDRPTAKELLNHTVFVTAPDISNIEIPSFSTGYDPEYESSLSSLISGAGELLVSGDDDDDDDDDNDDDDEDDEDDDEDDEDNDEDDEDSDEDDEDSDDEDDEDDGKDDNNNNDDDNDGRHVYGAEAEPWLGQSMSAEQQLESLESDFFLSLSGEDLERLVLNQLAENSSLTDNDINILSSPEDFDIQSLIDQINLDASNEQETLEWSYSMSDLTKLHIKDINGNLLFTIRERPTTSYGSLGKEHHGNIASVLRIEAFALTSDDGSPLDVHAEIGGQEQAVRVVRAHNTDNWEPYCWRVDVHGLVEQWTRF